MNCQEVRQKNILKAYIAHSLPEAQRDQFEEHFFGCDQCREQVEAARRARRTLRATQKRDRRVALRWIIGVAVVTLAVVIALWKTTPPETAKSTLDAAPPKPQISQGEPAPPALPQYENLARFSPPIFSVDTLRGAATPDGPFRDAMKSYSAGDFPAAARALRALLAKSPDLIEARFYLGISELLSNNTAPGIVDLRLVIDAGESEYLADARFYLAKAYLGTGHVAAADQLLRVLLAQQGRLATDADEILQQLPQQPLAK